VQNPIEVFEQHLGELLKGGQSLPAQLLYPLFEVVEHGPFIAVVPKSFQALFEHVGFKDTPVQLEEPVQDAALFRFQVLPAAQQQPLLPFDQIAHLRPFAEELGAPDLVHRVIGVLEDVELVIDDAALRSPLLNRCEAVTASRPYSAGRVPTYLHKRR